MELRIIDTQLVLQTLLQEKQEEGNEDFNNLFFKPVVNVASRYSESARVEVYVRNRTPLTAEPFRNPGWLEWGISVYSNHHDTRPLLYLAAIQRRPGAEVEFHS